MYNGLSDHIWPTEWLVAWYLSLFSSIKVQFWASWGSTWASSGISEPESTEAYCTASAFQAGHGHPPPSTQPLDHGSRLMQVKFTDICRNLLVSFWVHRWLCLSSGLLFLQRGLSLLCSKLASMPLALVGMLSFSPLCPLTGLPGMRWLRVRWKLPCPSVGTSWII